jgi:hypothetical protein
MVKAGKTMWNETVKANCSRAKSEASRCIPVSFAPRGGAGLTTYLALRRFVVEMALRHGRGAGPIPSLVEKVGKSRFQ